MADRLSSSDRSTRMASVKQAHTHPEVTLRKGLHRLGLRYVACDKRLPGSPDLVFPAYKSAVFVHGCFWHGHTCRMSALPKTNTTFWRTKQLANRARDLRKERALRALGWHVFTVWQCQLMGKEKVRTTVTRVHRRVCAAATPRTFVE